MDFIDRYNAFVGAAITILSAIFGGFWFLFAIYAMFNILDWLTGWAKARKLKQETSKTGILGLLKKMGYWVILLVAFLIPTAFVQLAAQFGADLMFLELLGWFALASLMVNEARSILENLVEMEYKVPLILIKGLAVTEKLINSKAEAILPEDSKE